MNYAIKLPERNTTKVFHVNLLKKWYTHTEEGTAYVNIIQDDQEKLPCPQTRAQSLEEATYGAYLTPEQRQTIMRMLARRPKLIDHCPGWTTLAHHRIETTDQPPIRQQPYRIPPAVKKDVVAELQELLKAGIIEESTSEWASPLVIVKKDGTNRICVDYRKLNAATKFDAYPMPRVDEMLDEIGDAQYLTTLDLTKDYWQVPMREEDKEKTAFSSPLGLLQFHSDSAEHPQLFND